MKTDLVEVNDTRKNLKVEIPSDIMRLRDEDPAAAVEWRAMTRRAFQWALAEGYEVTGFVAGEPRGYYVLARTEGR